MTDQCQEPTSQEKKIPNKTTTTKIPTQSSERADLPDHKTTNRTSQSQSNLSKKANSNDICENNSYQITTTVKKRTQLHTKKPQAIQ